MKFVIRKYNHLGYYKVIAYDMYGEPFLLKNQSTLLYEFKDKETAIAAAKEYKRLSLLAEYEEEEVEI